MCKSQLRLCQLWCLRFSIKRIFYSILVCKVILANEFLGKIGGEGMTVEVDELHLFWHKYGVGRKVKWEDQWLLGCYCRETKQCRMVLVKDRKRSTIMPLLLQFVDKNSTIITDFAHIYKGCEKFGFHAHKSVCHKRYFVCPADKDVYTNNMEVIWRWQKRGVLSCGNENFVERYLAESKYRHRYFYNLDMQPLPLDDKLLLFWHHIKLVYPRPGEEGMTFPTVNDPDEKTSEISIPNNGDSISDDDFDSPLKKKTSVPVKSVIELPNDTHSDVEGIDICGIAKQLCQSFLYNSLCVWISSRNQ